MLLGNYHTHTTRCHHATGNDQDYIEAAIACGYTALGISDHAPYPDDRWSHSRMSFAELPAYIEMFRSFKAMYSDQIQLYIGLEIEYVPEFLMYYQELYTSYGLEYLIFGNHMFYDQNKNLRDMFMVSDPDGVEAYTKHLLRGIKSGFFHFVAHPDGIFHSYPQWDDTAEACTHRILQAAIDYNIPLEYNVNGKRRRKRGIGYPTHAFWQIAKDYALNVIVSADAHRPTYLCDRFVQEGYAVVRQHDRWTLCEDFIKRK